MSKADIIEVLIKHSSQANPLPADKIIEFLKAEGKEINEASFYSNMRKLEKDNEVSCSNKLLIRYGTGHKYKFYQKFWWMQKGDEDRNDKELETKKEIGLKVHDFEKTVKRFSKQSGDPPRHSPKDREEFTLKLKREGANWKIRWETYLNNDRIIRSEFREGIDKWLNSSSKFEELAPLMKEIKEIIKQV